MKYPDLTWSFSRHKTMMTCLSKYYKQYYQSYNGWREQASPLAKHTFRLKNLTTLEIEIGNKVHEYIENLFTVGYRPDVHTEEKMFISIWNEILQLVDSSLNKQSKWYEDPRRKLLFDAYYNAIVPSEKLDELKGRLKGIAHNFFKSATFQEVIPNSLPVLKSTERFRYMKNGDIKILIKMDLLYLNRNAGKLILVDWKTGKISEDDRYQLALYSHYISNAYKRKLDQIEIANEYLIDNQHKSYQLMEIDIRNMRDVVMSSIGYMKGFLMDVERNIPLEESFFEQNANEQVCAFCNFKELCRKV